MRRIDQICDILTLAERYAGARRIAPATLAHRAMRSSTWLERCATGNVTIRSAITFVQWLSNHWPPGLEWPAGIDRPEPERGSPAGVLFSRPSRADGAPCSLEIARKRLQPVTKANGVQAPHPLRNESLAAAMRLGPSGQIASPGALCRALGLNRSVYYAVVRRYRDDIGAGRWPRAGSDSERMLNALSASEDVRFASRRSKAAA